MLRILIIFTFMCGFAFADERTFTDDIKYLTSDNNSYRETAAEIIKKLQEELEISLMAQEGKELGREMTLNKDKYISSTLASLGLEHLSQQEDASCVSPEQVGDPSIYIFISSSVPYETLKNYAETVRALTGDGIMVLNGTIGDPKEIMPTVDFVTKLSCGKSIKELQDDQSCDMARVDINPLLFRLFNVEEVPAIVLSDISYTELIGAVNLGEAVSPNRYGIMHGDVSVEYALNKFKGRFNTKSYMDKLKPGYFGRHL
jgi:type-F conjugative transfer system pilin assembly protein TrbC